MLTLAGGFGLTALLFASGAFICMGGTITSDYEREWGIAGIATLVLAVASALAAIWLAVAGL